MKPRPEGRRGDIEISVRSRERVRELEAPTPDVIYVALLQAPRRELKLIVRTSGDPSSAMPAIREAVGQIDPRLPIGQVRTMEKVKQLTLTSGTEPAWIIGSFAAMAALLAALGLYGVLSHSVNQRRREIGIRMALGAGTSDVLSHVLRHAAWLLCIGLAIGVIGAVALTRVLNTLLFEMSALDPLASPRRQAALVAVRGAVPASASPIQSPRSSGPDPPPTRPNNRASSSGPRSASFVTRCCGSVPSTSAGVRNGADSPEPAPSGVA